MAYVCTRKIYTQFQSYSLTDVKNLHYTYVRISIDIVRSNSIFEIFQIFFFFTEPHFDNDERIKSMSLLLELRAQISRSETMENKDE